MPRSLLILALILVAGSAWAGPEHDTMRERLLAALRSEDLDARAKAFGAIDAHGDFRTLRIAVEGVAYVLEDRQRIVRRVERDVATFENARRKDNEAEARIKTARKRRASSSRIKQLEAAERRTSRHRAAMLKVLERSRDALRTSRALLRNAPVHIGELLGRMSELERRNGLLLLRTSWASPHSPPEAWLVWVDALVASNRKPCANDLVGLVGEEAYPARLRALALDALVGLDPVRARKAAMAYLGADLDAAWQLAAAAVGVLRDVRAKVGIPALIAFLERKHIGRLRGDAHAALVALTHQGHGPYPGPWRRWWSQAGASFEVPPQEPKQPVGADGSSTAFYGIHTFSDRIAFVMDLSWSMWRHAGKARRIDTALEELRGAVGTLDESRRFAVVWFGTRTGYWKARTTVGNERAKRALERWAKDVDGKGQTNVYGGLDRAFRLARGKAERPCVDTIFFLTDGEATAGALRATPDVLAEVRAWCRVERIQLHSIGIGEHEPGLLEGLARLGRGRYVKR